jgi:hypothetical protein
MRRIKQILRRKENPKSKRFYFTHKHNTPTPPAPAKKKTARKLTRINEEPKNTSALGCQSPVDFETKLN